MGPFDIIVALGVIVSRAPVRNAQLVQRFDIPRRSKLRAVAHREGAFFAVIKSLFVTNSYSRDLAQRRPPFFSRFRYWHIPLRRDRGHKLSDILNVT
jgi:hypothetical protein